MKRIFLLFTFFISSFCSFAQRSVQIKNLWAEPQVHVLFGDYKISFTIRDINRALQLMAAAGDSTYGISCRLDSTKEYTVELFAGYRTQYHTSIQPILQFG